MQFCMYKYIFCKWKVDETEAASVQQSEEVLTFRKHTQQKTKA